MAKKFTRGLLVAAVLTAICALYVYVKYDPDQWIVFAHRLSNSLFQIALVVLMLGVIIFARIGSYRRRMGLKNYGAMLRFKQKEEYDQLKIDEAEMNEKDKERLKEHGRDITLLVTASAMILLCILLTITSTGL